MAKYSSYIELDPKYESVVDLKSEERNPNLWKDYIVHDDMAKALEKICESLKNDNPDARRGFWIEGTYGTGKSYSALVLKHLFDDTVENVGDFLDRPKIRDYKNKFLAIRKKGDFLSIWRSGVTDINSGTQLLMTIEMTIRELLKEKYGDKAYYGTNSVRQSILEKLNSQDYNWDAILQSEESLSDFNSIDEVRERVKREIDDIDSVGNKGQQTTLSAVAEICRKKGWALNTSIEQFEVWIKDVIDGNANLKNGGICFIWDEFTGYLSKEGTDSNILQRLSELCKKTPLYMFYIVHKEPAVISKIGEDNYEKIMHRYHVLSFHISQAAAYDLIGGAIRIRPGMHEQWDAIKAEKIKDITVTDFIHDIGGAGKPNEQINAVFPIHPMTLSLLTTVVGTYAASERTLFRFMKDTGNNNGFPYYIQNNEDDGWAWLTPDYLWDYFFMQNSDLRETGTEASKAYRHYDTIVNDRRLLTGKETDELHVFKAAMLLISIVSQKATYRRSHSVDNSIRATRSTLYKCFQGQLTEQAIKNILETLRSLDLLRLDETSLKGDARLELPYSLTGGDLFDTKYALIERNNSRHVLFAKNGVYSKEVESKLWDKNYATFNRIVIACSSFDTQSINTRLGEIKSELMKAPYKLGLLVVIVKDNTEWVACLEKIKNIAFEDKTERLVVCALKEPLTKSKLDEYYSNKTHEELARESGNKSSADQRAMDWAIKVQEWAASATAGFITAFYKDKQFNDISGSDKLRKIVENDVLYKVFPFAPERLITQTTAFKPAQDSAAYAALAPDKANVNTQVLNIVNPLKTYGVFEKTSLQDIENCTQTPQSSAIANLAKTIREILSESGSKIALSDLWSKLQSSPFGLYNTLTSAYLLGFVFKYYLNGEMHWVDGSGNPHPLTAENAKNMVARICKGEVVNDYLSSGSEAWRNFKAYVQNIFGLSDAESANEEEARKYVKVKEQSAGYPFWVLKYIDEEKYGGIDEKNTAIIIIDAICHFVFEQGNQEDIMTSVVGQFKGRGKLKSTLKSLYASKADSLGAFVNFICKNNSTIQTKIAKVGLNQVDFFDMLRQAMQGDVSTWIESEVIAKLSEIEIDLEIISLVNGITQSRNKTIAAIANELNNKFSTMKVPGSIIETLDYPWIVALKALNSLATIRSANLTVEIKHDISKALAQHGAEAWGKICAEKETIKDYVKKQGYSYSDGEIETIFAGLKTHPYQYNVEVFKTEISALIDNIEDVRRRKRICELWLIKSGKNTITEWCNDYNLPLDWLLRKESNEIRIIRAVQNKEPLSENDVKKAVLFLESANLSVLTDVNKIQDAFFATVGEKYRKIWTSKSDAILLKIKSRISNDVYTWALEISKIQGIFEEVLRETGKNEINDVKRKIARLSIEKLQERIAALLIEHPELYVFFEEEK